MYVLSATRLSGSMLLLASVCLSRHFTCLPILTTCWPKATIAKLYHRSVLGDGMAESDLFIKDRPLDDLLPEAFTSAGP